MLGTLLWLVDDEAGTDPHTWSVEVQLVRRGELLRVNERLAVEAPPAPLDALGLEALGVVEPGAQAALDAGGRRIAGGTQGPDLAERVGFEPTVRENRTPDFESGPFDHSGTSPQFRFFVRPDALRGVVHHCNAALRGRDCTQVPQILTARTTTKPVKSGHNAGPATAQRGEHCLSSRSNQKAMQHGDCLCACCSI